MEDMHFILVPLEEEDENKALFGVFDGHAGTEAAQEGISLFPKEFCKQLKASPNEIADVFRRTISAVDQAMLAYEYVGTTATIVYIWKEGEDRFLMAANLGDSSAFLCRDNVAVELTTDHKLTNPLEKQRLKDAGIETLDNQTRINGLAVSRALGDHFVKEQNIGLIADPFVSECYKIQPTDSHLIIASDGLWDIINGQQALDIIQAIPDSSDNNKGKQTHSGIAATTLLETALQSPKCNDNVTVIVIQLN